MLFATHYMKEKKSEDHHFLHHLITLCFYTGTQMLKMRKQIMAEISDGIASTYVYGRWHFRLVANSAW